MRVKVYLLLRLSIKNLSIGRAQGAQLNLFWISDHIATEPFGGPLSANCPDVKKLANFCSDGYLEFWANNLA